MSQARNENDIDAGYLHSGVWRAKRSENPGVCSTILTDKTVLKWFVSQGRNKNDINISYLHSGVWRAKRGETFEVRVTISKS